MEDEELRPFILEGPTFIPPLANDMDFKTMLKVFPTKGNLVYEYNPFLNYRLETAGFEYKGHIYTQEELKERFGIECTDDTQWTGLPDDDQPLLYEAGSLVNFDTSQLQFDINHPVDIIPQYSYDGSVNLILNDGKNIPRLINSRFTSLGKNIYEIVDRKGDNDVNIYDQGKQFDIDTSLYKRVVEIPDLDFIGVYPGGNMRVGNYVFYFKYMDDDGNETDFVAESGVVSVFIGDTMSSITGGTQDQNSYKSIRFLISNIDPGYSFVTVYYTRTTSDVSSEPIMSAHRILDRFEVTQSLSCQINITGFGNEEEIPVEEINTQYFIASSACAQTVAQNRLFMANVHKPDIPYKELTDLSLRIFPVVDTKPYTIPNRDYYDDYRNTYFDPNFIYNYTGYANGGEYYSFGIVYILADNSLSPVFPVLGAVNIYHEDDSVFEGADAIGDASEQFSRIAIYKEDESNPEGKIRVYISYDEETGQIVSQPSDNSYNIGDYGNVQNVWGVSSFDVQPEGANNDSNQIYYINFRMYESNYEAFFSILASLGIKGFFFVRKKRIPIRLCQAITISTDKSSYTPLIPVDNTLLKEYRGDIDFGESSTSHITERFLDEDRKLNVDFVSRLYVCDEMSTTGNAAICPDYDCWPGYYNQIFSGSSFYLVESSFMPTGNHFIMDPQNNRQMYVEPITNTDYNKDSKTTSQVVTVPDNTTVVSIRNSLWRGRAGEAEEAYRFEYLERDNRTDDATNIVRGIFGNYLGLDGYNKPCSYVDIKTSEAYNSSPYDSIKTRYADKSVYYAISKRYALKNFYSQTGGVLNTYKVSMQDLSGIYRGDSFICLFTHRFNRNFQDPEAPNNSKIVDEETWKNGYKLDSDDFSDINRGDVNAIPLGIWLTFPIVSNRNLNIRSLDPSYPEEEALTGHKRGYYPYYGISVDGSFKIPESGVHNAGLSANLGERWNQAVPDVPYIKNQFQTRIAYSDVHVNDAFKNGFRVFQATNFRDYTRTYGMIIKLVEFHESIICICEHGILFIAVNERTESGQGPGGSVFINTQNVLPMNPKVLSDMYGTQWAESVIKTPRYIYGVDTVAKKIWRTDGTNVQLISDFKIQEFLNQNISLTERELEPIIGIRNVKTHYNENKQDIMFTFYDNTVGFEEKVWNICFNELLDTFISFYSWLPSYSASIDNIYFSFDRNTSKWISKLGMCLADNSFSHGITLTNNTITRANTNNIGEFGIVGVQLPDIKTGISATYTYTLERDNFGYYKMFEIVKSGDKYILKLKDGITYDSLLANIFTMDQTTGRRVFLDRNNPNFKDTIVYQLNVRCDIDLQYNAEDDNIKQQYVNNWNGYKELDAGYYEYSIAVIPEDNMMFLTTDFWKHGQAGIIDIKDKIVPCVWYARQHPFEVEIVVVDDSSRHKVFENLQIIGNAAEPDSFHFEVTGDFYEWHDDKENIYFRQEAIKSLYQYNGSDILYDHNFPSIIPQQRIMADYNDKSTLFPLYYSRNDMFNYIEDYYKQATAPEKDYVYLSGTEITKYDTLQEYRMWTHIKGTNMLTAGRLRGNMWYQEDKWFVQIPSINFTQKNEDTWPNGLQTYIDKNGVQRFAQKPPLSIFNTPVPNDILNTNITNNDFPKDLRNLGYGTTDLDLSNWASDYVNDATGRKESRIRDKYCKIRIRYTGEKMVIIQAIKTIYFESWL